ncbi:hypothetical protein Cus16_1394 [Curtobacterium sp. ER1/6]|nr:hypothetical protein Cus16_1394 [Curtobacterium sp. ER1/6]
MACSSAPPPSPPRSSNTQHHQRDTTAAPRREGAAPGSGDGAFRRPAPRVPDGPWSVPPPPPARSGSSLRRRPLRGRLLVGGAPGTATLVPPRDLGIDVAHRGHHGRTAEQLPSGVLDARVEVDEDRADVVLDGERVEVVVEFGVLGPQGEGGRRDAADVLALYLRLDPPVGVVTSVVPGQGLAVVRVPLEEPAALGFLDPGAGVLLDVLQPQETAFLADLVRVEGAALDLAVHQLLVPVPGGSSQPVHACVDVVHRPSIMPPTADGRSGTARSAVRRGIGTSEGDEVHRRVHGIAPAVGARPDLRGRRRGDLGRGRPALQDHRRPRRPPAPRQCAGRVDRAGGRHEPARDRDHGERGPVRQHRGGRGQHPRRHRAADRGDRDPRRVRQAGEGREADHLARCFADPGARGGRRRGRARRGRRGQPAAAGPRRRSAHPRRRPHRGDLGRRAPARAARRQGAAVAPGRSGARRVPARVGPPHAEAGAAAHEHTEGRGRLLAVGPRDAGGGRRARARR